MANNVQCLLSSEVMLCYAMLLIFASTLAIRRDATLLIIASTIAIRSDAIQYSTDLCRTHLQNSPSASCFTIRRNSSTADESWN